MTRNPKEIEQDILRVRAQIEYCQKEYFELDEYRESWAEEEKAQLQSAWDGHAEKQRAYEAEYALATGTPYNHAQKSDAESSQGPESDIDMLIYDVLSLERSLTMYVDAVLQGYTKHTTELDTIKSDLSKARQILRNVDPNNYLVDDQRTEDFTNMLGEDSKYFSIARRYHYERIALFESCILRAESITRKARSKLNDARSKLKFISISMKVAINIPEKDSNERTDVRDARKLFNSETALYDRILEKVQPIQEEFDQREKALWQAVDENNSAASLPVKNSQDNAKRLNALSEAQSKLTKTLREIESLNVVVQQLILPDLTKMSEKPNADQSLALFVLKQTLSKLKPYTYETHYLDLESADISSKPKPAKVNVSVYSFKNLIKVISEPFEDVKKQHEALKNATEQEFEARLVLIKMSGKIDYHQYELKKAEQDLQKLIPHVGDKPTRAEIVAAEEQYENRQRLKESGKKMVNLGKKTLSFFKR